MLKMENRKKGDSKWNAADDVVHTFLKGAKHSDIKEKYSHEMMKIFRAHELDHVLRNKEKVKYSIKDLEMSAYLESMTKSSLALAAILRIARDGDVAHKPACEAIVSELLKYPDTPGLWELTHLENFNEEIKKRAKEIRVRMFKE